MGFCVPAENKEMADVVTKEIELGMWRNMWVMAGHRIFFFPLALIMGFSVHLFA